MRFAVEKLCDLVLSLFLQNLWFGDNSYEMKLLNYTNNLPKQVSVEGTKNSLGSILT